MAPTKDTPPHAALEEAVTVIFCLIDEAYRLFNLRAACRYQSLRRLSDSDVFLDTQLDL